MKRGDRITLDILSGYVLYQNRPWKCRPICICGKCNGETKNVTITVERVFYFADNSVEFTGTDDNGKHYARMLSAPSGDSC